MAANPLGDDVPRSVFWSWVWDSVRPVLGYLLVGIGLLAIVLGWIGVANESVVARQMPYVVSGGILGIGLLVLGARFLLIDDLRRDSGRLDRLETMMHEVHEVLLIQVEAGAETAKMTSRNAKAVDDEVGRGPEAVVVTPAKTAPARRPRAARR